MGKLVFTILSAVAEAERDRIRERIRDVKRDQATRQRFLGGARPFGWQVGEDGGLVEDPDEQAARTRILELRAEGASLRTIASKLAEGGFRLSHVGVARVLDQEAERAGLAA